MPHFSHAPEHGMETTRLLSGYIGGVIVKGNSVLSVVAGLMHATIRGPREHEDPTFWLKNTRDGRDKGFQSSRYLCGEFLFLWLAASSRQKSRAILEYIDYALSKNQKIFLTSTPIDPLRYPKYHLIETIRPLRGCRYIRHILSDTSKHLSQSGHSRVN